MGVALDQWRYIFIYSVRKASTGLVLVAFHNTDAMATKKKRGKVNGQTNNIYDDVKSIDFVPADEGRV